MSEKLPREYRYTYKLHLFAGYWNHDYQLVGRHGGLNLHITDMGDNTIGGERYSTGLEYHYREPPDHMTDQPPSQDECWLLKQPCWHDGTSLYARERYLPMFDGQNHERMFFALANEFKRHIPVTSDLERDEENT